MNRSTASNAIFAALCVCAIDVMIKVLKLGIICAWVTLNYVVAFIWINFFDNSQSSRDKA